MWCRCLVGCSVLFRQSPVRVDIVSNCQLYIRRAAEHDRRAAISLSVPVLFIRLFCKNEVHRLSEKMADTATLMEWGRNRHPFTWPHHPNRTLS